MSHASLSYSHAADLASALVTADPWLGRYRSRLVTALCEASEGATGGYDHDPVTDWGEQAVAERRTAILARLRRPEDWSIWALQLRTMRLAFSQEPLVSACLSQICKVDLSQLRLEASFDVSGLAFPTCVDFASTTFEHEAWLSACTFEDQVDFTGTRFDGSAVFERSHFISSASFDRARFHKSAEFRECHFHDIASFSSATFHGDVWMTGSRFSGEARFDDTRFCREAGVGAALFESAASFAGADFLDNAGFESARFSARISFDDARFHRPPRFAGATFAVHNDATIASQFSQVDDDRRQRSSRTNGISGRVDTIFGQRPIGRSPPVVDAQKIVRLKRI